MSTDKSHSDNLTPREVGHYFNMNADSIGLIAHDFLNIGSNLFYRGHTSRGLFIENLNGNIIFISNEQFRGPLTINCPSFTYLSFKANEKVGYVDKGRLIFTNSQYYFDLNQTPVYSSKDELLNLLWSSLDPKNVLSKLRNASASYGKPNEFADHMLGQQNPFLSGVLSSIAGAITNQDIHVFSDQAIKIIGRGQGLTPSGDDFMMGVLIADLLSASPIEGLGNELESLTSTRSTKVSANLMHCASLLEIDERLLDLWKFLIGREQELTSHLITALHWGNSSGLDFYCGLTWRVSII